MAHCRYNVADTACTSSVSKGSVYCSRHQCKASKSCKQMRDHREQYCQAHKCRVCHQERMFIDVSRGRPLQPKQRQWMVPYCKEHMCMKQYSDKPPRHCQRKRCEGAAAQLCEQHIVCAQSGCSSPRTGPLFCDAHRACRATKEPCANDRTSKNPFCADHTCPVRKCTAERPPGWRACESHGACKRAGCEAVRAKKSKYCAAHTCTFPKCKKEAVMSAGGPCMDHVCQNKSSCNKFRASLSNKKITHKGCEEHSS